jgi:methylated-DNA-[protein]-cysteine S-methyltransferase
MKPNIAVRFIADGDLLRTVELSLARTFSYEFVEASTQLRINLSEWIESYLSGKPKPIELPLTKTPFQQKVMGTLLKIPFGKTLSYSALAMNVGNPKGARAIGNACNKNQFPLLIPCHRIVQKSGKIGGFALGLEVKKRLLLFESNHNRIF